VITPSFDQLFSGCYRHVTANRCGNGRCLLSPKYFRRAIFQKQSLPKYDVLLLTIYRLSQIVSLSHLQSCCPSCSVTIVMASETPGSCTQHRFECYNMNCYRTFPTERGLRSHLWHSALFREYMLEERPYTSCREMSDVTQPRPAYGLQSTHLNPTMSMSLLLFSPFDEFDYGDSFAGYEDDKDYDNGDDDNCDDDNDGLVVEDESTDRLSAAAAGIDESFSSPRQQSLPPRDVIKKAHRGDVTLIGQRIRDPLQRSCTADMRPIGSFSFLLFHGITKPAGSRSRLAFADRPRNGKTPLQSVQHHQMGRTVFPGKARGMMA
jgi:hypothetical protein